MNRFIERWLASALFAGLVLAGASMAQPPGKKEGPPKGTVQAAPPSVNDIIERIMAFDKNKDGKITKDELPDRMHHLIELGDTNKDGALDRDEIQALATKLAAAPGGFGDGPFRIGPGPGGFGGGQVRGFGPPGPGVFAVGGAIRFGPDAVEGVVEDLKLSGKKKEQALAVAKVHQENVKKLMEQARAELLEKMKGILSDEEFQDFRAALDRPRGGTAIFAGPKGGGQKKIEQPPK